MADRSAWRGLKSLVHDAVDATTDLVGTGHASAHRRVQQVADAVGIGGPTRPIRGAVELGTKGILGSVKAVNWLVKLLSDTALDATSPVQPEPVPVPLRSDVLDSSAWIADAAVAALNASVGDHLAATRNPLDLGLQLRLADRYLTDERSKAPTLVLVHGLGTTEWCWSLDAHASFGDPAASLGTLLGADLGADVVYARYNTGRRIAVNGADLAEALERHFAGSSRIILLGHSMGGLVARAACHHAASVGHRWLSAVDWMISLGTPHQGAPLARFGASVTGHLSGFDTPATQVLAGILSGRSAGVRDLEHGDVHGGPHDERPPDVPHVVGPRYAFLGTTITQDPEHPAGRWLGDLVVQSCSASGVVEEVEEVHNVLLGGVPHYRIQADPRVLAALRVLLSVTPPAG